MSNLSRRTARKRPILIGAFRPAFFRLRNQDDLTKVISSFEKTLRGARFCQGEGSIDYHFVFSITHPLQSSVKLFESLGMRL
jgi:hypothetical protein